MGCAAPAVPDPDPGPDLDPSPDPDPGPGSVVIRDASEACAGASTGVFSDMPDAHPHRAGIECTAFWGIAGGYPDGTYRPWSEVTRAQMATFIVRAVEYRTGSAIEPVSPPFSDHLTSVHRDRIERLAAIGVTGGDASGNYDPQRRVDRGQMGSFMARSVAYLVDDDSANSSI